MAVRTSYVGTQVAGDVLTAANFTKVPGGWIGYAEAVATQTPITAEVDLTGLTVAVTVGSARRIKITGVTKPAMATIGDVVRLRIKEGATVLQEADVEENTAGRSLTLTGTVVLTPTSGAHTYKLSMERVAGAGNSSNNASATNPSFILVEDIGPAA